MKIYHSQGKFRAAALLKYLFGEFNSQVSYVMDGET
jgi:hypothetical protein